MPRSRLAVKAGQLVILDEARVRDLDDQGKEVLAHSLPTTGTFPVAMSRIPT